MGIEGEITCDLRLLWYMYISLGISMLASHMNFTQAVCAELILCVCIYVCVLMYLLYIVRPSSWM